MLTVDQVGPPFDWRNLTVCLGRVKRREVSQLLRRRFLMVHRPKALQLRLLTTAGEPTENALLRLLLVESLVRNHSSSSFS